MKRRILCLALCICMLVSLIPVVSAAPTPESLTDCTIEVIFGGALTRQAVKRDADGTYYAPITWVSYFGPNVVHEELPEFPGFSGNIDEGWHLFYLQEQEEYRPFARRTYINENTGKFVITLGADLDMQVRFVAEAKDFGTWEDRGTLLLSPPHEQQQLLNEYFSRPDTQLRRINEEYIISTEGTFSSVVKTDGETWVPLNEILALTEVNGSVTEDGKYLCLQPVQDSLLRFLYRRWDELQPLVFDEGDIIGEDVMAAGGWIVATASGRGGFYVGGKIQSYTDLFTAFLTDDEAYLAAFDAEADPDMEYMEQVSENAGELNNIFQDFSKRMEPVYKLILAGETNEMKDHYKSYFAPGKATSSTFGALISLGQYAHVYLNQIDDHREMLHAVYFYKANPEWPSYLAAKSVVNSYRDGAQKITAKFWETVNQTVTGIISDAILLSKVGPWYLFLKVGTLFMGDDYQYILDSSHVDENIEVSTYAYQVFEERIFASQFKGLHPNAIRLSLMLSLISSRHAYKTYWSGTDLRADTIAQIDEILAELYTAGRWQNVDAKDIWYVSKEAAAKELADLLPADNSTDPDTDHTDVKHTLIEQYGLSSQAQFVSCLGSEIQTYPAGIYGIISMIYLDINNDKDNELFVLRVSQTDNNEEAQIIAEVYQNTGNALQLCTSKKVYNVSFCTASNIYLFYSDTLSKYCLMIDSYSSGSYTGVNSWSAKVYTITNDSIDEYENWESVPFVGISVDFESEFKKINVPYAKYCTTYDNQNNAPYYQPLCEVEHEIFGDSSTYMTRNHKLKIKSTTDQENIATDETNSNASVMDYLLNTKDPAVFPAGTLKQDGSMYTGSFGQMKVQFQMGTDDFGEPCITFLSIQPNGVAFPFAYGLTTTSTMNEFIDGMQDLCDSTLVPLPEAAWMDSWFGPYIVHSQNVDFDVYEASAYWVVGSRAYQLVLSGGAKGRAAPDSINLFLCSSK